jgi:hypothetical protein
MLFDGEAWLRIREAAEPSRDALADWFDLDRLVRYLPPPGVPLGSDGAEQMGRQAIVGLMLWAGDHLA